MALAVLALATAAIYSGVRSHAFVNYDDGDYVVNNEHIRQGLTLDSIAWALTSTRTTGNWHPVTWMSHALDCQLFGLEAAGHHEMSVGLHVANTLLLAWILLAVTGAPGRSLLVAALFALHPLNVESVAWVAERKNVLSTFFFLLALCAYGRYVRKPGGWRYMTVAAAFVLGLASKPMVVTFPFALLLADYWPLRRVEGWSTASETYPVPQVPFRRCVWEKVPLVAMSAASSVITVLAQRSGGAVKTLEAASFPTRLANAACAYVAYLGKTVFPAHLAVFCPYAADSAGWKVGVCILLLMIVSWIAWSLRRQAPYLLVGWLWFLGTLVPAIGIVQVGAQAMADRYAYVPLMGVLVALVWGAGDLCARYGIKRVWQIATAGIVLLALSCVTWRQVSYWQDSVTLWSHALAVTADNAIAETQFGMALLVADRQEEAMERFEQAIALGTQDPTSYLNLGAYLSEHGRQKEAIPFLEKALGMNEDAENVVLTHLNLGFAYTSAGDYEQARRHYRAALQSDRRRVETTIQGLAEFAAAHPSARDYRKLGLLLEEDGKSDEAAGAFRRAAELE